MSQLWSLDQVWIGQVNVIVFQTRPRSNKTSYEFLHVFVILLFTKLKRANFTFHFAICLEQRNDISFQILPWNTSEGFWSSETSEASLNESTLESGTAK